MDYPLLLVDQLTPYLKSLRKELGLSQAELGLQVGVGQARMADIENRPGSVSVEQMMKVLAALDARLVIRQSTAPAAAIAPAKRGKVAASAPASAPTPARPPLRKATPKGSW
jgi:HTH-type transcriptional regulator/antitoxin HipB